MPRLTQRSWPKSWLTGIRFTVCHPEVFRVEQEIMSIVREGLGKGHRCRLVQSERGLTDSNATVISRSLHSAAGRADRVRIISAQGRSLDHGVNMECASPKAEAETPWLLQIPRWNRDEVRAHLDEDERETGGRRDILIVVEECAHAGDFLQLASQIASIPAAESLARARQLKVHRQPLEFVDGSLPTKTKGRLPPFKGRKPSELRLIIVGEDYPEDARLGWNDRIGREWILSLPDEQRGRFVQLDSTIPWPTEDEDFDWVGKELFGYRRGLLEIGTRRKIEGVKINPTRLRIEGVQRSRTVSLEELLRDGANVALVQPMPFRFTTGLQLEVLLDFKKDGMKLKKGEVVLVERVSDDELKLRDGRVVPSLFRAFAPGGIVREAAGFNSNRPDVVYVTNPLTADIFERLQGYPVSSRKIILTDDVPGAKAHIANQIHRDSEAKRLRKIERLIAGNSDNQFGVLPLRGSWEVRAEQPERAITHPGSTQLKRAAAPVGSKAPVLPTAPDEACPSRDRSAYTDSNAGAGKSTAPADSAEAPQSGLSFHGLVLPSQHDEEDENTATKPISDPNSAKSDARTGADVPDAPSGKLKHSKKKAKKKKTGKATKQMEEDRDLPR